MCPCLRLVQPTVPYLVSMTVTGVAKAGMAMRRTDKNFMMYGMIVKSMAMNNVVTFVSGTQGNQTGKRGRFLLWHWSQIFRAEGTMIMIEHGHYWYGCDLCDHLMCD